VPLRFWNFQINKWTRKVISISSRELLLYWMSLSHLDSWLLYNLLKAWESRSFSLSLIWFWILWSAALEIKCHCMGSQVWFISGNREAFDDTHIPPTSHPTFVTYSSSGHPSLSTAEPQSSRKHKLYHLGSFVRTSRGNLPCPINEKHPPPQDSNNNHPILPVS